MVTGVDTVTAKVVIVNVALLAPEGIVTLADVSVITAPCAPAVPVSVTEFCVVGLPPTTEVGFRTTEFRVGVTGLEEHPPDVPPPPLYSKAPISITPTDVLVSEHVG